MPDYPPPLFRLLPIDGPWPWCCRSCGYPDHPFAPGIKQTPPYAACRPTMEAVVDCRRRPIAGRTILPSAARAQHVNDATDNPAVIRGMSAGLVCGQMRFDHRPGIVAQPEKTAHYRLHHVLAGRESVLMRPFNELIGFLNRQVHDITLCPWRIGIAASLQHS